MSEPIAAVTAPANPDSNLRSSASIGGSNSDSKLLTDVDEHTLNRITERVIGCAYDVSNGLGSGFLEKVYENAMLVELTRAGLKVRQQFPIKVAWRGAIVGDYDADLLVEDCVLVELKACKALDEVHVAQCINYLKATGLKVCLLINFGRPKLEIRRIVNKF